MLSVLIVLENHFQFGIGNSLELEDKAQSQWVEVNSRKKKFSTTSPFFNMVTKRKYKPNVEGKNYCLGRKNNKEIRELASKVDIVNGRQFTI